jgi:aerobic-type carbon monoxide dehydrogenase small subunit (CoxS/CutS family)|tara:strand:+ start:339 stop:797 length:459 start_codon:yes stop_codon:yes gene_type:complete
MKLTVNEVEYDFEVDEDTPLLWVLRDTLGMTGTKFACGVAQCGACSVMVDGELQRSCTLPISTLEGRSVSTVEGLSRDNSHPVQQAWIAEDVPQCGYCQSGQIMAAAALLESYPNPSDEQIDSAMTNICRCGSYLRIRKAIHRAIREPQQEI